MLDQNITTLLATIIGGIFAIVGGFIATWVSQRLARNAEKRKVAREKSQEIFELFIQVKRWIDNEINRWWERTDETATIYPPVSDTLECPIDRLLILVILYVPPLEKTAKELNEKVMRFNSDEWDYRDRGAFPSYNVLADLRAESKKLADFEQRFTDEIKKFVAKT